MYISNPVRDLFLFGLPGHPLKGEIHLPYRSSYEIGEKDGDEGGLSRSDPLRCRNAHSLYRFSLLKL